MTSINHILGSSSITVFVDGKSCTVAKDARTYPMVIEAINEGNLDKLRKAVNIRQSIYDSLKKVSDNITMNDNQIFYKDREVTGLIASRVFEVIKEGLDVAPMIKFIENLMLNPSKRAVDELFGFMDACNLPITSDGHFLAYKRVRDDYKDCHSGTMDNSVGQVREMERNQVDEDKNNTCSYGLHFCSYDYLKHFPGARIVVLKINPADVVAIPADYNNSKGRTCKYEVVDEIPLNEYNMPSVEIKEGYEDEYDEYCDSEEEYLEQDDPWFDDIQEVNTKSSSSAKLTEAEVREIKEALGEYDGPSVADLAKYFGVSERQIRRIRDGEAWRWVKI